MSLFLRNARASFTLGALIAVVILGGVADAQGRLPPCPDSEDARWHNCQGTFVWPDGEKHVGEFRDDKRNGKGARYSSGGAVLEQGIWKDGGLVAEADITSVAPRSAPTYPLMATTGPRSAASSPPIAGPAPRVVALPAEAPKRIVSPDSEKRCIAQAETARTEQLRAVGAFSSKVLSNYDTKRQSCFARMTVMPTGRPVATFTEFRIDVAFNTLLATIGHCHGDSAIRMISDKSDKVAAKPNLSEVQSYIDEKMGGKR